MKQRRASSGSPLERDQAEVLEHFMGGQKTKEDWLLDESQPLATNIEKTTCTSTVLTFDSQRISDLPNTLT